MFEGRPGLVISIALVRRVKRLSSNKNIGLTGE